MDDEIQRRSALLSALMARYFGETCPSLVQKWDAALAGLAPRFLRELAGRLRVIEEISNKVNREIRELRRSSGDGPALERALAQLELLMETADALMVRLDELLRST